jgi:hypothetical protein
MPAPVRAFLAALLGLLVGTGATPASATPEGPARVVCEIRRGHWGQTARFGGPHGLSAIPGGRPYVHVTGGAVRRVLVHPGPAGRPFGAEAEAGGLLLTGYLRPGPGGLRVFPTRAMTLGGLLWPGPFQPLHLVHDPVAGFRVAPLGPLPAALGVPIGRLQARVPCGDVSLDPSPAFFLQSSSRALPSVVPTRLRPGAALPLLARPGGPTLAILRPSRPDEVLLLVQPSVGGWAPVEWHLPAGEIRGWVEERRLREAEVKKPPDDELGGLGLGGGGRGGRGHVPEDHCLRCESEVPLTIEVPAGPGAAPRRPPRLVVGRFRRRACIPLTGPWAGDRALARLWLPDELRFEPGVRLLVTRAHLLGCDPVRGQPRCRWG